MKMAISVLDSLVRAGMKHVVLSPGSRSAPLAYALAVLEEKKVISTHVRIDERSAGFLALGLAKESQEPVAVVTTSGTAVGELMPAVMEAFHSAIPLVVLSADRPERLRGTGANQTTVQPGIFGQFVRGQIDLRNYPEEVPGEETKDFRKVLSQAFGRDEDWMPAPDQLRGPVHINLAFDTPLTPDAQAAPLLQQWAQSLSSHQFPESKKVKTQVTSLHFAPQREGKTVVIAGDGAGQIAQDFATALDLPLFAEPSAGLDRAPNAVLAYRLLAGTDLWESIERVVLFGHPTLSRPITALLDKTSLDRALYTPVQPAWFEPGKRPERLIRSLEELAEFAGRGPKALDHNKGSWLHSWQEAGQKIYRGLLEQVREYEATGHNTGRAAGMSLALRAWETATEEDEVLLTGSSNIIRDLDLIAPWNSGAYTNSTEPDQPAGSHPLPRVLASRGLAGIDGTISVGAGISLATALGDEPAQAVRIICGDLTFLHDAMSLNIGPLEGQPRLSIEVLNDRGGGIFSTLEHGELGKTQDFASTVTRYFTTPHTVNLQELARALGQNQGITVKVTSIAD